MSWGFQVVIIFLLCCVPVVSGSSNRTLTRTLPHADAVFSLSPTTFSSYVLRRRALFPFPVLNVSVVNATFSLTDRCLSLLPAAISGPQWEKITMYAISPFAAPPVNDDQQIIVGGRVYTEEFFQRMRLSEGVFLTFSGSDLFTATGEFTLKIPGDCMLEAVDEAPSTLTFRIVETPRSVTGQLFSFLQVVSSVFAFLCTIGGALVPIAVTQVPAVLSLTSCAPPSLLIEADTTKLIIFPFNIEIGDLPLSERTLLLILGLIGICALLETAHYFIDKLRGVSIEDHPDTQESQKEGKEEGKEDGHFMFRTKRPSAPFIGSVVLCTIAIGTTYHATAAAFAASTLAISAIGVVLGLLSIAGLPMLAMRFAMSKQLFFCPWRVSDTKIPDAIHPLGVWGPNTMRLRWGVFFENFNTSRRSLAVATLLYVAMIALLTGASPRSRAGCERTGAATILLTLTYGVVMYITSALRSRFSNMLLAAINLLTLLFELLLAITAGKLDEGDSADAILSGAFIVGALAAVACIAFSASHLIIIVWEAHGSHAFRHVAVASRSRKNPAKAQEELENQIEEGALNIIETFRRHLEDEDEEEEEGRMAAATKVPSSRSENYKAVRPSQLVAHDSREHPTLAEYLLTDYEMVPQATRQDFRRLAAERRQANRLSWLDDQFSKRGTGKRTHER